MLLLIDNYDSFTYNLYQYFSEMGQEVKVVRNDKITLDEIEVLIPDGIVISPGPSHPLNAGISNDVIHRFGPHLPLLGVCLGHQCIAHSYGGRIVKAGQVMHGKASKIEHNELGIFKGLPCPFTGIRYHSLTVEEESLPNCLIITARSDDGTIMGIKHKQHPVEGIQFHPESFMTEHGKKLLSNFLLQGGIS